VQGVQGIIDLPRGESFFVTGVPKTIIKVHGGAPRLYSGMRSGQVTLVVDGRTGHSGRELFQCGYNRHLGRGLQCAAIRCRARGSYRERRGDYRDPRWSNYWRTDAEYLGAYFNGLAAGWPSRLPDSPSNWQAVKSRLNVLLQME